MGHISIGFSGTRNSLSPDRTLQLEKVLSKYKNATLHHGDCIGADTLAHAIALELGFSIVVHPPINNSMRAFCHFESGHSMLPKPYLERNKDIVDATELLIACPNDPLQEELRSGTWATIRYARKQGKEVIII